jgi:hypothetical protein
MIAFATGFIVTPSRLVGGHVSHKAFAARLSLVVQFEVKTLQDEAILARFIR